MPRIQAADPAMVILDAAAALFATRGVKGTSVQEVGDAVGVSKTAVLHRFGSKDALLARVDEAVLALLHAAVEPLVGTTEGCERDMRAVTSILDCALAHPGIVAYGLAGSATLDLRRTVLTAFVDAPERIDDERLVRISSALSAVAMLAQIARREDRVAAWRPLIISTSAATLHGACPLAHQEDGSQ